MSVLSNTLAEKPHPEARSPAQDRLLAEASRLTPQDACKKVDSSLEGLSAAEAEVRLKKFGPNLVARERKATITEELWSRARNPLNALLLTS